MALASVVVRVLEANWMLEASVYGVLAVALLSLNVHDLAFLLNVLSEDQAAKVLQAALLQ